MDTSESPKRHRPTESKIEMDLYFLPERLPAPLRHPPDAAGDPDALIRFGRAEGHLSPSSDGDKGWRVTLTVCPPGEGHFMGIDLSVPEAKKLIKAVDYVIKWQKKLKDRHEVPPKIGKKDKGKKAKADAEATSATKTKKKKKP